MTEKAMNELREAAQSAADREAYMRKVEQAARLAGYHTPETIDAFKRGIYFGRMAGLADAGDSLASVLSDTIRLFRRTN